MIPTSHFVQVIQVEREQQLRRWQLTHSALLERAARPGVATRLLATLDARRARRAQRAGLPCPDGRCASAAC